MYKTEAFIKPAFPGAHIHDPEDGSCLAAEGELKALTPYWRRLLFHGDVVETRPKKEKESAVAAVKE